MKLAMVSSLYCAVTGQLDESLAHQDRARSLCGRELTALTTGWSAGTCWPCTATPTWAISAGSPGCRSVASARSSPPPVTKVLCPGITSQVALAEGALTEAGTLANAALASSRQPRSST